LFYKPRRGLFLTILTQNRDTERYYINPLHMVIRATFLSNLIHAAGRSIIGFPVVEKLTRSNHAAWKPQVCSALRGAQLAGYVDGTIKEPTKTVAKSATDTEQVPYPTYTMWEAHKH
jgi:hypothetical protein